MQHSQRQFFSPSESLTWFPVPVAANSFRWSVPICDSMASGVRNNTIQEFYGFGFRPWEFSKRPVFSGG
jgi:hypothetical protein